MNLFEPATPERPACHGKTEQAITERLQRAIDAYRSKGGDRRVVGGTSTR